MLNFLLLGISDQKMMRRVVSHIPSIVAGSCVAVLAKASSTTSAAQGTSHVGTAVRVASYNVLSDSLCRASHYCHSKPEDLDNKARLVKVKAKLQEEMDKGAIICLQVWSVTYSSVGRSQRPPTSPHLTLLVALLRSAFQGGEPQVGWSAGPLLRGQRVSEPNAFTPLPSRVSSSTVGARGRGGMTRPVQWRPPPQVQLRRGALRQRVQWLHGRVRGMAAGYARGRVGGGAAGH